MEHSLKNPYPCVEQDDQRSYGGNQCWSPSKSMREYGCGVIAWTDLLLYLHRNKTGCAAEFFDRVQERGALALEAYNHYADLLRWRYLPILPPLGLNSFVLAGGLNCYFWRYRVPLRARWGVWSSRLWRAVGQMLDQDIPVILAIGPNFPFLWQQHKVTLYTKSTQGDYLVSCAVKAHYVTVTGIDEKWMRVSSWGKEYYVNQAEYTRYVRKYSCGLFSNIAYIREKGRR